MLVSKLIAAVLAAGTALAAGTPADLVDPRIDTHKARWIYFASACRPFGMVTLSPDTNVGGDWGSGYLYNEKYIRCFSHIHDWEMAGIPVMPVVGPMNGHKGYETYKAPFSHDNEVVRAGYHKVVLEDSKVVVELTSTTRVGFHRYSFPATQSAHVLFDVGAPLAMTKMQDSSIRRTGLKSLAGSATMAPTRRREKPVTVYFVAEFDRPFAAFGVWEKGVVHEDALAVRGAGAGGYASFRFDRPEKLLMKVAISYVSEANARANLAAELSGWDFDGAVRASADEWNQWLGRIKVDGGSERQRVKFYTDLWHALLGRHIFSDADGSYIDNTGPQPKARRVPLDAQGKPTRTTHNSDAFWGSQWNLNILWSMAYPKVLSDMASTLIDYYHNGGMIARGPSGGNYTFVMVGDQATPLIAAAYNKGIRDFDVDAAWAGSRKNAFPGGIRDRAGYETGPNPTGGGMPQYVAKGWVPEGLPGKSMHRDGAGMTIEYSFSDWCLGQFAKALGKNEDFDFFQKRSGNWKNLYDPSTGYLRPKTQNGGWLTPFEPNCRAKTCTGYVEASGAVYTWFVPQDVAGLAKLMGGTDKYVERLNHQFEKAAPEHFLAQDWVDYSNQPSCEMAHLFSHAGAPWLTQYWVRRVKEETFGDITPFAGYNGDEDQGQMGGLGVLMAIGLFDIQGGAAVEPRYEITSPIFDRVAIQLDPRYYKGKEFVIAVENNSPANVYIQSATLNGKPLADRFWITHREFAQGGQLTLRLGSQPNKNWGKAAAAR
jgi:predicted alpha-1,2-mannosidase